MKSIKCPKCGHNIKGVVPVHTQADVVKQVLKAAARHVRTMEELASIYASLAHISYASARRAIQRLAKNGYLFRVRPGFYTKL
jgi:hypothetical protein